MTPPPADSPTPAERRSTAGVVMLLLAIAAWALPRAIQAGDAGEFSAVMLGGGVPHPSGYPWMRLLGWPARALFALGLPAATATALPCALLGIAGFGFLHRVALRCVPPTPGRGRAAIASLITLLVASASPIVLHTMDAEVWGPLVFAAGLFTWAALVRGVHPAGLGLLLGLAVSHHLSAVLLVPLAIGGAWPRSGGLRAIARAGGFGLLGSAVGLLPYLTLAIGAGPDTAWAWGDTASLPGLLHHVTRADYGVFELSLHTERPPASAQLQRALDSLGGALTARLSPHWSLAGVVVVIPLVLALRRRAVLPTPPRIGLVATVVLSGLLFPLAHNLDPTSPFSRWILERFDILPLVMSIPVCALALGPLPAAVAGRGRAGVGLAVGGALLVVRQLVFTAWHGVPADNPWIEKYAVDALTTPDTPAVLVGTDDHRTFPLLFAHTALGVGDDVVYIDASLLSHAWYRARLRRRLPELPDIDKPVLLLTTMQADPAWDDTALYLTNDFSRHSVGLPRVPEGVLWRLVHPRLPPPSADAVVGRHKAALARYGPIPREAFFSGHPFAIDLLTAYTETTAQLAQALQSEGREAEAEALLRFGFDPTAVP